MGIEKSLLPVETLKTILDNKNIVKSNVEVYQKNADWETFQLAMRILNPQSYGLQFEIRIRNAYGWTKNKAKERNGDVSYMLDGVKINSEIKVSLTTDVNKNINIVQIRNSHSMDYYDIFVIHQDSSVERFRLSKEQMNEELKLTGFNLAHGTRVGKDGDNENAEYRIDFLAIKTDKTYQRWLENYLIKDGADILTSYNPNAIIDSKPNLQESNEQ